MSNEFEEIVLKKLDVLGDSLENTNERLGSLETEMKDTKHGLEDLNIKVNSTNERLGNLETEVKDTKHGLEDLNIKVNSTNERLGSLETEVKDTNHGLEDLNIKVNSTNERLGILEMEVKDTEEVVNYLNQNFTKFDFEINKKIDTLFDSYTASKEKNSVYEENIISLNAKTFNHDIRISNLENKVLTA